jgi:1-deoxy-D-xylulose-5-phosphate reductoisomerase
MSTETPRTLAILGSTGSIGRSTLEVARRHPERFSVRYMTAHANAELLIAQVREFRPSAVGVTDPAAWRAVRDAVGGMTEVLHGTTALVDIARRTDYTTLVSSLVGFAGLLPTVAAIESGRDVALANKETLVVAGEIITRLLDKHGARLLPVDSEHSAILQCLAGEAPESVRRIILTASGGPFRGRTHEQLRDVTRAEALRHPNWSMGAKITIDSATLMNKGLEVIEAHWLFGVPGERIDVVVHPQSIIHSMVEFTDGSIKAQMGVPDMKLPIHYALFWPDRVPADYHRLDFRSCATLTFEEPDLGTFRCLRLAYDALACGGTAPTVLNAANEIAVAAFLADRLPFHGIAAVIEDTLAAIPAVQAASIDAIVQADGRARMHATARVAAITPSH